MSSAWEKTQEQYQRKLERQRKLEELEQIGQSSPYQAPAPPVYMDRAAMHTTAPILSINNDSMHSSPNSSIGGGSSIMGGSVVTGIQPHQTPTTAAPVLPTSTGSTTGSVGSTSGGKNRPKGAIENARRFLWDEGDDEDEDEDAGGYAIGRNLNGADGTGETEMLKATTIHLSPSPQKKEAALPMNTGIMANFSNLLVWGNNTPRHELPPKPRQINLAARQSSFTLEDSDADAREADEYISVVKQRYTPMQNCFYIIADNIYEAFLSCGECTRPIIDFFSTHCRLLMILFLVLVGIVVLSVTLVVTNNNAMRDAQDHNQTPDDRYKIQDRVRYEALFDLIVNSRFTNTSALEATGSPQDLALRWLTDEDPAQLALDHSALLQRYALAVLFFATYDVSSMAAEDDSPLTRRRRRIQSRSAAFGWSDDEFWMSEKGICMWAGVYCAPHLHEGAPESQYNENSDVIKVNLTSNNLKGTLPTELAALENLESLDLGLNDLLGSIPTELGSLRHLRELYMEENELTGTIPTEVGLWPRLRDLFLGNNQFVGTIPNELSWLKEMRALALDDNLLTGTIPALNNLTKMIVLYLDNNALTGSFPREIGVMEKLIDLRVRKNNLNGTLPDTIGSLSHLELIYVDNNEFSGTIPNVFATTPRLTELHVYQNKLKGSLPESMQTLNKLKIIYADNNDLTGTLPTGFGVLGDLQILYTNYNYMEGTIPTEYGNLRDMTDFEVIGNKFTGTLPSELGNMYQLETLQIQGNDFVGTVPEEWGRMERLEYFTLFDNNIGGTMPKVICDAKVNFQLTFVAADCQEYGREKIICTCCNACY